MKKWFVLAFLLTVSFISFVSMAADTQITLEKGNSKQFNIEGVEYTIKAESFDPSLDAVNISVTNGSSSSSSLVPQGSSKIINGVYVFADIVTAWNDGNSGVAVLTVGPESYECKSDGAFVDYYPRSSCTLQEAMDMAMIGVIMHEGTYSIQPHVVDGKRVGLEISGTKLLSANGTVVLDFNGADIGIYVLNAQPMIEKLHIRNSFDGIYSKDASPAIMNVSIEADGSGVVCTTISPIYTIVSSSKIRATHHFGVVAKDSCLVDVEKSDVSGGEAAVLVDSYYSKRWSLIQSSNLHGSEKGLWAKYNSNVSVMNSTISENKIGIVAEGDAVVKIQNTDISGNSGDGSPGSAIRSYGNSVVYIAGGTNTFSSNTDGNCMSYDGNSIFGTTDLFSGKCPSNTYLIRNVDESRRDGYKADGFRVELDSHHTGAVAKMSIFSPYTNTLLVYDERDIPAYTTSIFIPAYINHNIPLLYELNITNKKTGMLLASRRAAVFFSTTECGIMPTCDEMELDNGRITLIGYENDSGEMEYYIARPLSFSGSESCDGEASFDIRTLVDYDKDPYNPERVDLKSGSEARVFGKTWEVAVCKDNVTLTAKPQPAEKTEYNIEKDRNGAYVLYMKGPESSNVIAREEYGGKLLSLSEPLDIAGSMMPVAWYGPANFDRVLKLYDTAGGTEREIGSLTLDATSDCNPFGECRNITLSFSYAYYFKDPNRMDIVHKVYIVASEPAKNIHHEVLRLDASAAPKTESHETIDYSGGEVNLFGRDWEVSESSSGIVLNPSEGASLSYEIEKSKIDGDRHKTIVFEVRGNVANPESKYMDIGICYSGSDFCEHFNKEKTPMSNLESGGKYVVSFDSPVTNANRRVTLSIMDIKTGDIVSSKSIDIPGDGICLEKGCKLLFNKAVVVSGGKAYRMDLFYGEGGSGMTVLKLYSGKNEDPENVLMYRGRKIDFAGREWVIDDIENHGNIRMAKFSVVGVQNENVLEISDEGYFYRIVPAEGIDSMDLYVEYLPGHTESFNDVGKSGITIGKAPFKFKITALAGSKSEEHMLDGSGCELNLSSGCGNRVLIPLGIPTGIIFDGEKAVVTASQDSGGIAVYVYSEGDGNRRQLSTALREGGYVHMGTEKWNFRGIVEIGGAFFAHFRREISSEDGTKTTVSTIEPIPTTVSGEGPGGNGSPESRCNGCEINGKCIPIGYRTNNQYCSLYGMEQQKTDGEYCNNNFECSSNLCISNKCVSNNLLTRILEWFRKLFVPEQDCKVENGGVVVDNSHCQDLSSAVRAISKSGGSGTIWVRKNITEININPEKRIGSIRMVFENENSVIIGNISGVGSISFENGNFVVGRSRFKEHPRFDGSQISFLNSSILIKRPFDIDGSTVLIQNSTVEFTLPFNFALNGGRKKSIFEVMINITHSPHVYIGNSEFIYDGTHAGSVMLINGATISLSGNRFSGTFLMPYGKDISITGNAFFNSSASGPSLTFDLTYGYPDRILLENNSFENVWGGREYPAVAVYMVSENPDEEQCIETIERLIPESDALTNLFFEPPVFESSDSGARYLTAGCIITKRDSNENHIYLYDSIFQPVFRQKVLEIAIIPVKSENGVEAVDVSWNPAFRTFDEAVNHIREVSEDTMKYLEQGSEYRLSGQKSLFYGRVGDIITVKGKIPRNENSPSSREGQKSPDYKKILTDMLVEKTGHDICYYVDTLGVDEVWFWGYHGDGIYPTESNMASRPKASCDFGGYCDISNSAKINDLPLCNRTYVLYNYNFEAGVGEALEDHTHQLESVLSFVGLHDGLDGNLFWDEFVNPYNTDGENACGWTHYPPNGEHDYDWYNEKYVKSYCESWNPFGNHPSKEINCGEWFRELYGSDKCFDDGGTAFKVWWMRSMPGRGNKIVSESGKRMRDWWEFTGDFDNAVKRGVSFFE